MPYSERQAWAWVARTYAFDQFITKQVADGVDMVVNLAAGLDARPYRMDLPAALKWIEVDLPELLSYKEEILPIISEDESRALKPDYYLVLPWHFLDEFVEREQEFLQSGGQFIVPLPEVRVISG